MNKKTLLLGLGLALLLVGVALAMSGGEFRVPWDVVSSGGPSGEGRLSPLYRVGDTIGQTAIGQTEGGEFRVKAGYWYGAGALGAVITPTPTASLLVQVAFQGGGASGTARWVNVVTTTLSGGGTASDGTYAVTTTNTGAYTLTGIVPATYTVVVTSPHTLANRRLSVVVTPAMDVVNMCTLREGNANMDNQVTIADFGILAASYLKTSVQPGYNWMADFDKSGQVNITDFGLLASNYLRTGPLACP